MYQSNAKEERKDEIATITCQKRLAAKHIPEDAYGSKSCEICIPDEIQDTIDVCIFTDMYMSDCMHIYIYYTHKDICMEIISGYGLALNATQYFTCNYGVKCDIFSVSIMTYSRSGESFCEKQWEKKVNFHQGLFYSLWIPS